MIRIAAITLASDSVITIARFRPSKRATRCPANVRKAFWCICNFPFFPLKTSNLGIRQTSFLACRGTWFLRAENTFGVCFCPSDCNWKLPTCSSTSLLTVVLQTLKFRAFLLTIRAFLVTIGLLLEIEAFLLYDGKVPLIRKILVSVKFLSALLGPEMGASILWTPGKNAFSLQEKPMSIKFLLLGGGGVCWVFFGGECRFYFCGRADFSDLIAPKRTVTKEAQL